jgi:hypothetical protein
LTHLGISRYIKKIGKSSVKKFQCGCQTVIRRILFALLEVLADSNILKRLEARQTIYTKLDIAVKLGFPEKDFNMYRKAIF